MLQQYTVLVFVDTASHRLWGGGIWLPDVVGVTKLFRKRRRDRLFRTGGGAESLVARPLTDYLSISSTRPPCFLSNRAGGPPTRRKASCECTVTSSPLGSRLTPRRASCWRGWGLTCRACCTSWAHSRCFLFQRWSSPIGMHLCTSYIQHYVCVQYCVDLHNEISSCSLRAGFLRLCSCLSDPHPRVLTSVRQLVLNSLARSRLGMIFKR